MLKVEQIFVGGHDKNFSYVLHDEESLEGVVIDPNGKIEKVLDFIEEKNLQIKYLVNTHSHHDHIQHNDLMVEKFQVPVVMHREEPAPKDVAVEDGEEWALGQETFRFLHTPGHTLGGLCLLAQGQLITGDTLFVGRSGRTVFPGGSPSAMVESMKKIASLDDDVVIYPGHNYGEWPTSTVGKEKTYNKCLQAKTLEDFRALGI